MNRNLTSKKNKSSIVSGVCFFAATAIISKILGAIYRIPLTNILGLDGIAKYQLVFPFYALVIALICGGVPTCVSRFVAFYNGKNAPFESVNLTSCALFYLGILSVVGVAICVLLAKPLARLQGNPDISLAYIVIAPSIFFVGISSVFKGFFLGSSNMLPSSIGNLVEQIFKLSFGLVLAKTHMQFGLINSVGAALSAVTGAELVEFIILLVMYLKAKPTRADKLASVLKNNSSAFFSSLAPITFSSLVFPIVAFVDSVVIIALLSLGGLEKGVATSQYGLLHGAVNTLVNMPVVISLALSMAIVPTVSSALACYDVVSIKEKTTLSLKFSLLISAACFFGFFVLARPVLQTLYPTIASSELDLATKLFRVQSINIIFLSTLEILNAMLQGLDRSKKVLRNLAIGGALKLIAQTLLVPYLQILGVAIANILFYAVSMSLNAALYKKLVGNCAILLENVSKILASGVIMFVTVALSTYFLQGAILKLTIGILVGIVTYGISVFSLKAVTKNDLIGRAHV